MRLKTLQSKLGALLAAPNQFDSSEHADQSGDEFAGIADWVQTPADANLTPDDRINIYRNSSIAVRESALSEIYPAIQSLLGETYFEAAAGRYAAGHPARSKDLNQYGQEFAEFLRELPGLVEQSPYIFDVARYEWMRSEVMHTPPVDGQTAVRVLKSAYPLDRIYTMCFDEDAAGINLDEDRGDDETFRFLLYRAGAEVLTRPIDRELFDTISRM